MLRLFSSISFFPRRRCTCPICDPPPPRKYITMKLHYEHWTEFGPVARERIKGQALELFTSWMMNLEPEETTEEQVQFARLILEL